MSLLSFLRPPQPTRPTRAAVESDVRALIAQREAARQRKADAFERAWHEMDRTHLTTEQILEEYVAEVAA